MRVLYIHPKFPYRGKDLFPIGLGYLAGISKDRADIMVIDENVESFSIAKITDFRPDIIGITATTPSFQRALEITGKLKKSSNATVVMGGVHATFNPEEALLGGADIVVRGEGEKTFSELIDLKDLEKIDGISYRENGRFVHNPDRALIKDLDDIPFPAHDYFRIENYKIMSIISARGCPYSCAYCSATRFWKNQVRYRSTKNVLEELKRIAEMGFNLVRFMDSTFTLDKKRVLEICDMIKDEDLDIKWSCETRADHLDDEILRAMSTSGCNLICMGIDSASQEILERCDRKVDVAVMEAAFEKARKYKIPVRAYITFGLPGETERSVKQTIKFLYKVRPRQILMSLATAYPGTDLSGGRYIKMHPNWVAKFHGHGPGGNLYLPEGMTRKEYIRLADYMLKEIKKCTHYSLYPKLER